MINCEGPKFGLNSLDDCWVELLFLLRSFETGLSVSRGRRETNRQTYGFLVHFSHRRWPHPGHCGDPSTNKL